MTADLLTDLAFHMGHPVVNGCRCDNPDCGLHELGYRYARDEEDASALVLSDTRWFPCTEGCPGWAVFQPNGAQAGDGLEIERCDECGRFPDDDAVLIYLNDTLLPFLHLLAKQREPHPAPRTQELRKNLAESIIESARRHGEDSEPDHEVGDLQAAVRAATA